MSRRRYHASGQFSTTSMQDAFIAAMHIWVQRHADDDTIVIPAGAVTRAELVRVIYALLAARRGHSQQNETLSRQRRCAHKPNQTKKPAAAAVTRNAAGNSQLI
jgi:hypothetical protein